MFYFLNHHASYFSDSCSVSTIVLVFLSDLYISIFSENKVVSTAALLISFYISKMWVSELWLCCVCVTIEREPQALMQSYLLGHILHAGVGRGVKAGTGEAGVGQEVQGSEH